MPQRPIKAMASGTAQHACTWTVLTRRPPRTTCRRGVVPPAGKGGSAALVTLQPTNTTSDMGPTSSWLNSLCVRIISPLVRLPRAAKVPLCGCG
jgi:hypothetical protein